MSIKITTWNVNGLRAIYKKGLNDYLIKTKPDLLCLQEIKAKPEQLNEVQQPIGDYQALYSPAEKLGYSGTAFIHNNKKVELKKTFYGLGSKKFDSEGRYIVTRINGIDVYNIYFPSGTSGEVRQDYKYKFLNHFYKHLKNLPKARLDKLIICGDFNICHKEIDIHHPKKAEKLELSGFLPKERQWMDKFSDLGFVDSFRHVNGDIKDTYTWWSYRAGARQKNLGWRIDYIFVSQKLARVIKNCIIEKEVTGSDHCPVSLEIDI